MSAYKMSIIALPAFQDNYIWIIHDDLTNTLIAIDPGDATPVLAYATKAARPLTHILLTHHHHDHIGGVGELLKHYPTCQVYGPEDKRIPHRHHLATPVEALLLGPFTFQILSTPGHTSTHICYYEREQAWLFCGDTLFSAGCGRVFDGTIEQLFASLQRINQLPDETMVFCAHEYTRSNLAFAIDVEPDNQAIRDYQYRLNQNNRLCSLPSTLAQEREVNPFLRTSIGTLSQFAAEHRIDIHDAFGLFKQLREEKNKR